MASSSIFGNQSTTLEKNTKIFVTKKTVRFGKNVYQTHNIAGFSEGEVDIGQIPWVLVLLLLLFSLIVNSFNGGIGALLLLAGLAGGIWNLVKPKHYGFLLTLNSGDKKLFVTPDKDGLKKVIIDIYDFIEKEKDATYEISIINSTITGNFVLGGATSVSFNSANDSFKTSANISRSWS
jgi:hypothetical protein